MSDVPIFILDYVDNNINYSLKEAYLELICGLKIEKSLADEEFKKVLSNILVPYFDRTEEEHKAILVKANKELLRYKKRWYTYVLKEYTENDSKRKTILYDVEFAEKLLETLGQEQFEKVYQCKTIEEVKLKLLKNIELWSIDKNTYLSSFKYLKYKTKKQIETALEIDFNKSITSIVLKDFDGNLKNFVLSSPDVLNNIPIFTPDGHKINYSLLDNNEEELYNDYLVDSDYIIRTIMKRNKNDNNSSIKVEYNKSLDDVDKFIINYMGSTKKTERFLEDKVVEIEIGELVNKIYKSDGAWNYQDIESRIKNIARCQISGLLKKEGTVKDTIFVINFFQEAFIRTDAITNRRIAEVKFSDSLFQEFINSNTIRNYLPQIKELKNSLSNILIASFQKERLQCYIKDIGYQRKYSYSFFKSKVRFKSKKELINMNQINECIQEYVDKKMIIKEFKYNNNDDKDISFDVIYYPPDEYEIKNFINDTISEDDDMRFLG